MPILPGRRLGPYEILSAIGVGGMGEVYKARDTRLQRTVAIKILPHDKVADPERKRRFLQEARAASALNHPNIVTLYDIANDHGVDYLVMEFVSGKSLSNLITPRGLPLAEALHYAQQIASALAAAHAAGIVHRDIKPANVVVTPEGQVKILDFGLAKLEERHVETQIQTRTMEPTLTEAGVVMGTAGYMSPEQARGEEVDARADLFSFGAVLYEMATGRRPFQKALDWTAPPTDALQPELKRIVLKLLQVDRELRYQTAVEVQADLRRLQGSVEGTGTSQRWWTSATAALLVIVLALITAYAIIRRTQRAVNGRSATVRAEYSRVTSQPGVEWFPSLSPDGKWLVYAADAGAANRHIFLQSVNGQNPLDLTRDSTADDDQPAFSPDGELIAFRSSRDGGGIFVMGRTGEAARRVTREGFNPSWSPDGTQLAFTTEDVELYPQNLGDGELWTVTVNTGETRRLLDHAALPSWSPHNHRIAFTSLQGNRSLGGVWTIPVKSGTATPVTRDPARDWNPVWSPDGKYLYFVSDRSGSMNLWRVPIDEVSGKTLAEPEPITTPAVYLAHPSFSADGKRIAYSSVIITANIQQLTLDTSMAVKGEPAWVTSGSRLWSSPDPSPDGEWLVFYSLTQPEGQIYVSHPDGTGLRQVTNDMAVNRMPRWSPDGKWIVSNSDRRGPQAVWRIRPDGSELQQLTEGGGGFYPTWSPDGSRIAVGLVGLQSLPGKQAAWIFDPNHPWKQETAEVLPALDWSPSFLHPTSWSADGEQLAGMLGGDPGNGIVTYSLRSHKYERLTDFGEWPAWFPDNRHILFVAGGKAFFAVDTRSKQARKIFSVTRDVIGPPRLTRDGTKAYFSRRVTESNIWLLTLK